jgi:predicted aconitase with swiveling domain
MGMKRLSVSLRCHKIIGGHGEGEALVSHEPVCFYLTDPKTGVVRERTHELFGKTVSNRVLVFPSGKASSVVQIDGLFKLVQNGFAPAAMIVKDVETVLVVSALSPRFLLLTGWRGIRWKQFARVILLRWTLTKVQLSFGRRRRVGFEHHVVNS